MPQAIETCNGISVAGDDGHVLSVTSRPEFLEGQLPLDGEPVDPNIFHTRRSFDNHCRSAGESVELSEGPTATDDFVPIAKLRIRR